MEEKTAIIKNWLGSGSINVFGLPYSGKDTVGIKLAEILGARFLSSGLILRDAEKNDRDLGAELNRGALAPSNKFRDIVLPYFSRPDLTKFPLILSSVGRWTGEEAPTIEAAAAGGHPIKAIILLNVSEADIKIRWDAARVLQDRGQRGDDKEVKILDTRVDEFRNKTMPVIQRYHAMGILIPVNADQAKEAVLNETLSKLAEFAINHVSTSQ
ncbi:MAG: nucleoside monophosphate kinase [Candidatus Nomurabacteria bacterium]|jgi:adenylate kinase family enzyme|nr:nucleoside monophosphate kinase [Candidatus Nomurabacteria bacterium]